ncbi:BON domain-containing protein [Malikia granosa]|uniref:Transporter n=1 Tax=Malikia granosa TaxID=263067 RepID=A0A2S9K9M4_9BURK|nr:BON domain-containing protein [Malikia granosa]PRD67138.1 transporter [Malikia granosa]
MKTLTFPLRRGTAALLLVATLGGLLSGCAPLMLGAAVGTGLVASDRRTSGAQLEDEAIELKASNRITEAMGTRVRVNVTSYNRQVLLSGEVPNEADRQRVQQTVSGVDNVRSVVNELAITDSPTLSQRTSDLVLSGRVKAGFIDHQELSSQAFKVVAERGTIYLMGRVTKREADLATEIARTTSGVKAVVRIFDYISEEELKRLQAPPAREPQSKPL